MVETEDVYFEKYDDALKLAQKENRFGPYNLLQICYYDGSEEKKTNLKNLIHLPKPSIEETLFKLNTRIPTKIYHKNKQEITKSLEEFKNEKLLKYQSLIKEIKGLSLEPSKTLRVYISAEYGSKNLIYLYKVLKNYFIKHGFDVLFKENNEITLNDDFFNASNIKSFNPHITININRLRNEYLNDKTFNFIWFQDPTLILYDNSKFKERERDIYFYLTELIKNALMRKVSRTSNIYWQPFRSINEFFYRNESINIENKISFIGNNYLQILNPTKEYNKETELLNELSTLFNEGKLSRKKIDSLSKKYFDLGKIRREEHLDVFLISAIVRIECLKWLCSQSYIDVEIYGEGWDKITELKPYNKGKLIGINEVRKVINESKYSFIVHPEYYYQQRLFEACSCGSIPIIFSDQTNPEEFHYTENALLFKTKEDLYNILKNKVIPKKSPKYISKEMTYDILIKDIHNIINIHKGF